MTFVDLLGFGPKGWGLALLTGAFLTLIVSIVALLIGSAFGALIAWAKLSKSLAANMVGDAYTTLFRGVPELLIIYLFLKLFYS